MEKGTDLALIEALRRLGPSAAETILEEAEDKDAAATAIAEMLAEGRLLLTRRKKLALPEQTGLIYGRFQGSARGYGFCIPADGGADFFVPAENVHGAMHGDSIWVRKADTLSRNGSAEAEVVMVAVRAQRRIVGSFERDAQGNAYVVPDESRLSGDLLVMRGEEGGAKDGDKVVAEISQYPDGRRPLLGRVAEVIGARSAKGTDMLALIRRMELPEGFSKSAAQQARRLNKAPGQDAVARREDLRGLQSITIDGADAKDLDDAVSLSRLACGNWLLGVHIADVSAYVAEGTPLDKEAYKRGTSIYLPDRVLPMFPPAISNGVCSLNAGEDKLTLSCMMEISPEGRVLCYRIAETVIRTAHRMTYEDVNAMYAGDEALRERFANLWPMLEEMRALSSVLQSRRIKRGAIDFALDEAHIVLDKRGKAVDLQIAERGEANRMIEAFMLAANETVARHMQEMGLPMLYRVHEQPDREKLQTLTAFLATLGYSLKPSGALRPATLQKLLDKAKGTKEESVVNSVVLRTLKKARYAAEGLGHFGLALEHYCHFTSPIRRYPDLVVHRLVKELLHGELNEKRAARWRERLGETARHCSERETLAVEAERAAEDMKKAEYMQSRVGMVESGVIAGLAQYGFFVRLPNTAEGLVRTASLGDDFYSHDEKNFRVVGRRTKRAFRLGDTARVLVAGVDVENASVEFRLAEAERPKGRGNGAPKAGEKAAKTEGAPVQKGKRRTGTRKRKANGAPKA